jgi:hypothetical protein
VAVESLEIGDIVVTASGARRPIKWMGWRSYSGRLLAGRRDMLPVCFSAGSLGEGLPRRDLFVSPKHAMFPNGALVPAEHLVNGPVADPAWMARMTSADVRALTPLVWSHVSPYCTFDLDMTARLDLEVREAA